MGGGSIDRSDLCSLSLAESSAGATDICRRGSNGVDVWARAKHYSACDWTGPVGGTRGVGVPNGLAPPHACRAGVLHMAALSSGRLPDLPAYSETTGYFRTLVGDLQDDLDSCHNSGRHGSQLR